MERIAELRLLLADGTITREQLTELRSLIMEQAEELGAIVQNPAEALADTPAAERGPIVAQAATDLTDLAALAATAADLDAELVQADAQIAADAQAALDRIRAVNTPVEPEGDDGDDGDGDVPADTAAPADGGDTAADDDRQLVTAATPTPAAAPPARRTPPAVSRVAARAPQMPSAAPIVPQRHMSLVAAANVPGITAGESLDDPERFASAMAQALRAGAGHRGPVTRVPVASSRVEYDDARMLTDDVRANARKLNAVVGRDAIIASGGACAPTTTLYDLPHLGSAARPVRDQLLVRFGADRGGVRVMAPPKLTDLDAAVSTWTAETDATPGGSTKPCLKATCPSPSEELVDAIVRCLKFGNFQARFFAEMTQAWMDLAAVQWAREAETKALTEIGSKSTNVNVGQGLGTTRDVLAALDRAAAGMRNRHRIDPSFPLRWGFPAWLLDNMRTDLARELPGAASERLAVADATLMGFFAARNINAVPFLDGETGQVFGAQGTGPLLGWPTTVVTYLFPEGSFLFLDGGTLDLGVVRDSSLNGTNDFQMFAESFEGVVFHGVESMRLTIDICPSGKSSAAASFDPCAFGS